MAVLRSCCCHLRFNQSISIPISYLYRHHGPHKLQRRHRYPGFVWQSDPSHRRFADISPPARFSSLTWRAGNSGLGLESCLRFAQHKPSHIYLGARSRSKAEAAIAKIKEAVPDAPITYLEMDLADLASVKKSAETFLASADRLDILMNNAGSTCSSPSFSQSPSN